MSNSKLLKYEVINTKKDKKLNGEVFDFKKVKSKGGPTTKPRAKKHQLDLLSLEMNKENLINLLCKNLISKKNLIRELKNKSQI
jgi:hypothetical protein